jgi:hypothetical protein
MGSKARNNFGLLYSCQHGSAYSSTNKSSPLSKCLTKNNMALMIRSTEEALFGSGLKLISVSVFK